MKILVAVTTIFSAILLDNVNGVSVQPGGGVMCTMVYKICPEGQYWGTASSGCPDCLPCPLKNYAQCKDGSSPTKDPVVENQCATYSCKTEPTVMCTLEYKICAEDQFLGTGPSGCPECLACPKVKLAACKDGSSPTKDPHVENQCPTYSCKTQQPVLCTMEYKICKQGQYLGTGTSGCPECLPCRIPRIACANGSSPTPSKFVQNQCQTYTCPPPRFGPGPIKILPAIQPAVV